MEGIVIEDQTREEFKPSTGYFIGLGLIQMIYDDKLISEEEYINMMNIYKKEYIS